MIDFVIASAVRRDASETTRHRRPPHIKSGSLPLLWTVFGADGLRKMSGQIFIIYGRDDSSASAGRLLTGL
jgi:hypothetical protein